jgi:hypothetical protein
MMIGQKMLTRNPLKNLVYSLALIGLGNAVLKSSHAKGADRD